MKIINNIKFWILENSILNIKTLDKKYYDKIKEISFIDFVGIFLLTSFISKMVKTKKNENE